MRLATVRPVSRIRVFRYRGDFGGGFLEGERRQFYRMPGENAVVVLVVWTRASRIEAELVSGRVSYGVSHIEFPRVRYRRMLASADDRPD